MEQIGAKILVWVCPLLGSHLNYLIHYKSKIGNLKTQVEELKVALERLKRRVDNATMNVMKIEAQFTRLITKSEEIIAVAGKIHEDYARSATMTYCNGSCPNLIFRYQLSKRAEEAALKAKNLKDEIYEIKSVGYRERPRLVGTVKLNSGYTDIGSREPTINGVLKELKDPDINRIGVSGMGGVGKTMLVKEVVNQAEKHNLFDNYVFVVVSKEPELIKIQTEIAKQLGLDLNKEDEFGNQDLLRERLQQGKILLVMDDIWEALKLEDVGYTSGADQKGCKLLLTSRFYRALNDMGTQKQFDVGILLKEEARDLFEKIIGDSAKNHEIQQIMLQIVEECSRLPVAITTVANALKKQENICVWKNALYGFQICNPKQIYGMNENVYKSIKWSYEFLKDNEAKSLWLLCSLHGEDYDIEVENLIRFCVGWNLFGDLGKIEQVRCRVRTLVEELKDCSLLLDGNDNGTVKMHDIIRDVAIDIAGEERQMFTIRSSAELQKRSKWKNSTVISLPYVNDDLELPNQFECSKLELLLLFGQKIGFCLPESFFKGLKDLEVLRLSTSRSGVLPSSLSSLENLQTLCLYGDVQNAIIIGELKNLKALSLSLYYTVRLPKEIGQLTHLQLLDLRGCSELEFIPPNVLSNLKRLEELYLPDNDGWEVQVQSTDDDEWEVEEQSTEKINAMVSELNHLSDLTRLHICIANAKTLPEDRVFEGLVSFRIALGSARLGVETLWEETPETPRILELNNISFQSDCGYKVLFSKCETLILDKMEGVKNNLYELDSEGFQSLKHLTVKGNDEIQYIFKSTEVLDSVFPSLESITLWYVKNLERICCTRPPAKTFCNLREVRVFNCCKLEFFFSSMVGCFSHLQRMRIEDCKIMSAIVAIAREEEIEVNSDDRIMFANLESLTLGNLLNLKGFVSAVDSLVLFNEKVVFPNLEELEMKGMDIIKIIWPNQLISDSFRKLRTVDINGCSSLKSIFPTSVAKALMQLEVLKIMNCAKVEEIVAKEEGIETTTLSIFQRLTWLALQNLPELKRFYSEKYISEWSLLEYMRIVNCDKLIIFGSNKSSVQETNGLARHANLIQQPLFFIEKPEKFPNLESLSLDDAMNETCGGPSVELCCNLKELNLYGTRKISNVEAPIARAGVSDFRRLKNIVPFSSTSFHCLKELYVSGSDVLISLLTPSTARTLVQLKEIRIWNCHRMTEIVANDGSEAEAGDEIVFNNLTLLLFNDFPSLTAFHSGNRTIKFPSLDRVIVERCPKLKIFCSGVLSTPKLTKVEMGKKRTHKKKGDGDLDLNATIENFAEKTSASEVRESEHDANDNLERDTTSEVGNTQHDGE